jgi:hypothetical protein
LALGEEEDAGALEVLAAQGGQVDLVAGDCSSFSFFLFFFFYPHGF